MNIGEKPLDCNSKLEHQWYIQRKVMAEALLQGVKGDWTFPSLCLPSLPYKSSYTWPASPTKDTDFIILAITLFSSPVNSGSDSVQQCDDAEKGCSKSVLC